MDDYIGQWQGKPSALHNLIQELNQLNNEIKFTLELEDLAIWIPLF